MLPAHYVVEFGQGIDVGYDSKLHMQSTILLALISTASLRLLPHLTRSSPIDLRTLAG